MAQNIFGKRSSQPSIDSSIQRTSTVFGVITLIKQEIDNSLGNMQIHLATLANTLNAFGQIDIDYALQIFAFESFKNDNFIDTIQELQTEMTAQSGLINFGHIVQLTDIASIGRQNIGQRIFHLGQSAHFLIAGSLFQSRASCSHLS